MLGERVLLHMSLVYNHTNNICLSEDLIQIMNAGNNLLYGVLLSSEVDFLLVTDWNSIWGG